MQLAHDLCQNSLDNTLTRLSAISQSTSKQIPRCRKVKFSQFFTEGEVARQMAKMLTIKDGATIGDHGAGTGILCASVLAYSLAQQQSTSQPFNLNAYEIDERLYPAFNKSMETIGEFAKEMLNHSPNVSLNGDFTDVAQKLMQGHSCQVLDAAILNPPYQKLNQKTDFAKCLREYFVPCPNIYAAFIVLSIELLKPYGELVAIVPRSFTNGTYFKPFRKWLRQQGSIDWFVRYKGRSNLFRNDNVLQENVTFRFTKMKPQAERVRVSLCESPAQAPEYESMVPVDDILPSDSDMIFVPSSPDELNALHKMRAMPLNAKQAGLTFSTGKFEDFRMREKLSHNVPEKNWAPVIYSQHWQRGNDLAWSPTIKGKPACLNTDTSTEKKLIERGNYVLIKRISANDDSTGRCHPCAILEDSNIPGDRWAIDNHIQVISGLNGKTLSKTQALKLVDYLSSPSIDLVLRLISGTTQINKNELEHIRYGHDILSMPA